MFRHALRASIAYKNAVNTCTQRRQKLFTIVALDAAKSGNDDLFNEQARQRALEITNTRSTGNLPDVLPIYEKMEVRLVGKECARFALMRGCLCVAEHIILADDEPPPTRTNLVENPSSSSSCLWRSYFVLWTLIGHCATRTCRRFPRLGTAVGCSCCNQPLDTSECN